MVKQEQIIRFSIVVPVYNGEHFLRRCVESICCDLGNDWELILVDDGSTDRSGLICRQLAQEDRRIQVVHQRNMGPGGARNAGCQLARGEYIWFVDCDDEIEPGALTCLRSACERHHADVFSFDYVADSGKKQCRISVGIGEENVPFSLKERPWFLCSAPAVWLRVWKRSLFEEHGIMFPEGVFYGEDLLTSVKLLTLADSIVLLHRPLYCHQNQPCSLMNQASECRNFDMVGVFSELLGWFGEKEIREVYNPQLYALAVEHLLLAASVRIAKCNPVSPFLEEIRQFIDEHFPEWKTCTYVRQLPSSKKAALYLVSRRYYRVLGFLFRLKGRLI